MSKILIFPMSAFCIHQAQKITEALARLGISRFSMAYHQNALKKIVEKYYLGMLDTEAFKEEIKILFKQELVQPDSFEEIWLKIKNDNFKKYFEQIKGIQGDQFYFLGNLTPAQHAGIECLLPTDDKFEFLFSYQHQKLEHALFSKLLEKFNQQDTVFVVCPPPPPANFLWDLVDSIFSPINAWLKKMAIGDYNEYKKKSTKSNYIFITFDVNNEEKITLQKILSKVSSYHDAEEQGTSYCPYYQSTPYAVGKAVRREEIVPAASSFQPVRFNY